MLKDIKNQMNDLAETFQKDFFDLTKEKKIMDYLGHLKKKQVIVAGCETEALPVAVAGEPDVQNPGGRHHHRRLTSCPRKLHPGIEEEVGHIQQQQPSEEKAEQHTRSDGGSALPE